MEPDWLRSLGRSLAPAAPSEKPDKVRIVAFLCTRQQLAEWRNQQAAVARPPPVLAESAPSPQRRLENFRTRVFQESKRARRSRQLAAARQRESSDSEDFVFY